MPWYWPFACAMGFRLEFIPRLDGGVPMVIVSGLFWTYGPRVTSRLAGSLESSTLSGIGDAARDRLAGIESERNRKNAENIFKQYQNTVEIKAMMREIVDTIHRFGGPGSNAGSSLLSIFGKR